MSSAVSVERQKMVKAFVGEIILTSPELGTDGAILKTRELLAAVREIEKLESGVMVVIFPDRGEKYLSTNLFMV